MRRLLTRHGPAVRWSIAAYVLAVVLVTSTFARFWDQPILEQHAFRQTPTALSVYWGVVDGWRLDYLTPVVGAPWSVPFEFPIFQWMVSVCWRLSGFPLDSCGRLTSFIFYLASSVVLARLLLLLKISAPAVAASSIAFLLAPVHLFWGRAFLIESCALFMTLLYAAETVAVMSSRVLGWKYWFRVAILILIASAAALIKITTFVAGAVFAILFLICRRYTAPALQPWREYLKQAKLEYCALLIPMVVAIAFTAAWVSYSDGVKQENFIAELFTSRNLAVWNFGTNEQRLSRSLWLDTIWERSISESIGWFAAITATLVGILLIRGYQLWLLASFTLTYLASFVVFTNLHIVHNYYQVAAAAWVVAALGVVLDRLQQISFPAFVTACSIVFAEQIYTFSGGYLPWIRDPLHLAAERTLRLAPAIQLMTEPDEVVLVLGYEWSSELAYYAERRTIAVPNFAGLAPKVVAQLNTMARPYNATLVVSCNDRIRSQVDHMLRQMQQGAETKTPDAL